MVRLFVAIFCLSLLTGCMTAAQHRKALVDESSDKLTVGVVQKEIKHGMSGAEVASVLGSPNIVTSDKQGQEAWIYDKVSTDYAYSNSSGGVNSLILGFGSALAGGGAGSYNANAGASSRNQKTLTIIIKFIEGKVHEYTYRSSSF